MDKARYSGVTCVEGSFSDLPTSSSSSSSSDTSSTSTGDDPPPTCTLELPPHAKPLLDMIKDHAGV